MSGLTEGGNAVRHLLANAAIASSRVARSHGPRVGRRYASGGRLLLWESASSLGNERRR